MNRRTFLQTRISSALLLFVVLLIMSIGCSKKREHIIDDNEIEQAEIVYKVVYEMSEDVQTTEFNQTPMEDIGFGVLIYYVNDANEMIAITEPNERDLQMPFFEEWLYKFEPSVNSYPNEIEDGSEWINELVLDCRENNTIYRVEFNGEFKVSCREWIPLQNDSNEDDKIDLTDFANWAREREVE